MASLENCMHSITVLGNQLQLLPEKAVYVPQLKMLLLSDVHLGKSETFQALGIPVPNAVNKSTLDRLYTVCSNYDLEYVFVLGDLFHSKYALVDEVLGPWIEFTQSVKASVKLIIGNHDRNFIPKLEQLSINCIFDAIQIDNLVLSHEPEPRSSCLNICGHIHPCVRIKSRLDYLRLPCFYFEHTQNQLILPSFGEFTGGYEVPLKTGTTAYVIAEDSVIPFVGKG